MTFKDRFKTAWNILRNKDPTETMYSGEEKNTYYGTNPSRNKFNFTNERSIMAAICNRISLDAAAMEMKHCRVDEFGRYIEDIDSKLNYCLTVEANIDQTARALRHDIVMSMLEEGCIAVVPTDYTLNPYRTDSYDILAMRVCRILEWRPYQVKVSVYDERTGKRKEIWVDKSIAAIMENPFFVVMNQYNSTMKRLAKKLALIDKTDEKTASGKISMLVQLPYTIKTEARRQQAEKRRKDIEDQLHNNKYGIAYTDATEKITQLSTPLENQLVQEAKDLTDQLFAQIGMTNEILNGSANEETMVNYYNRTIEPILSTIADEFIRTFISKTARSKMQTIKYFRDPFRLVTVKSISEMADSFTRNEILSSNEIRQILGYKPSDDPKADQLINSNINPMMGEQGMPDQNQLYQQYYEQMMNGENPQPPEEYNTEVQQEEIQNGI